MPIYNPPPTGGGGPATQIDSDSTILDINVIADGQFLKRSGATVIGDTPAGGAADIKTTEINFGNPPVNEKIFSIADVTVVGGQQIMAMQSYDAATNRTADENEFADFACIAGQPSAGVGFQLKVRTYNMHKELQGLFKINYMLG